jgi:hypothetical protein
MVVLRSFRSRRLFVLLVVGLTFVQAARLGAQTPLVDTAYWWPSYLPPGASVNYASPPTNVGPLPGSASWYRVILAPEGAAVPGLSTVTVYFGVPQGLLSTDGASTVDLTPPLPTGYQFQPSPPRADILYRSSFEATTPCGPGVVISSRNDLVVAARSSVTCRIDFDGRPTLSGVPAGLVVVSRGPAAQQPERTALAVLWAGPHNAEQLRPSVTLTVSSYALSAPISDIRPYDLPEMNTGGRRAWIATSANYVGFTVLVGQHTIVNVQGIGLSVPVAEAIAASLAPVSEAKWGELVGPTVPGTVPQPPSPNPVPTQSSVPSAGASAESLATGSTVPVPALSPQSASSGSLCSFVDRRVVEKLLGAKAQRAYGSLGPVEEVCTIVGPQDIAFEIRWQRQTVKKSMADAVVTSRVANGVAWRKGTVRGLASGNISAGTDGRRIVRVSAFTFRFGQLGNFSVDGAAARDLTISVLQRFAKGPVASAQRLPN